MKYLVVLMLVLPLLCGAAWLAVQVSDRDTPVTDALVTIVPNQIEPGRAMQVDVRVFYRRSCVTYVTRHLYDHNGMSYTAPELMLPASQIGLVHSASTVPLPLAFAPGEGRLFSEPSYACNWFQLHFWPVKAATRVATFFAVPSELNGVVP